jgi:exosome complex component RRP42
VIAMSNENIKKHVASYFNKGIRYDGRKLTQYRDISIEFDVSNSAEGSAKVKIGNTEVIAGVKLGIEKPYPDTPDEGMLMVNVELLPLSSPDFESGPPDVKSIELARVIDRGLRESKAIDNKKLCIEPGEKVWSVMVDICTLNDEGNITDCAGLAAIAAILNTKFPAHENNKVDYKTKTDQKLPLSKVPIPVTVIKIDNHLLIDPIIEEEKIIDARLTVTSTEEGYICALQKGGDTALLDTEVIEMVNLGIEKAQELRTYLKGE